MNKQEIEKAIKQLEWVLQDTKNRMLTDEAVNVIYPLAIFSLTQQSTEQPKEPCYRQVKCRYNETGCGDCEYTHNLNKPLTVGDKIRESNESLADYLQENITECGICKAKTGTCSYSDTDCISAWRDYLNQPYTV